MLVTDLQFYAPYYADAYKKLAQDIPLLRLLEQRSIILEFYNQIPEHSWSYSYAEGKWSIRKVVQHWLDAELIFNYRALSTVRGEKKPLMGWEPDEYANCIHEEELSKEKLLKSIEIQAKYTHHLFSQFTPLDLSKVGHANGYDTQVAAMGFAIIAHEMHHRNVIQSNYLLK